jgi:hypothetical protein
MATTSGSPNSKVYSNAHVLSGRLQRPVDQIIERHAEIVLTEKDRHLTRFIEGVNIEGLVSFQRGRTRVSRSLSLKNDPKNNGIVTVSTAVVEGLNVFEVITANRVVAQVSTDYPLDSGRRGRDGSPEPANYPHVTFLGTHFDSVLVNGGLLTIKLDLGMIGEREGDKSYLSHRDFLKRVKEQNEQNEGIANKKKLPELRRMFADRAAAVGTLKKSPKVTFSIVESIDNLDAIPIPGVDVVGNVLILPHFGTVALGEVEVSEVIHEGSDVPSNYFELTMFKINMGCVGHGTVTGVVAASNGHSGPPKPPGT